MTTRQRIDLIGRAYPRLFPRAQMTRLMEAQLGGVDALDRGNVRAPKIIYHICAGNLAISACTSLVHGLLLGARNIVKLPGVRDDSTAHQEILAFIRGLPTSLRNLVQTHATLDETLLRGADAVIAFGSDATMESLRGKLRFDQKFIPHGHALSLLFISGALNTRQAEACATDILTYDQLGCLSPQAIYVPSGIDLASLGEKLARALESHWRRIKKKPARPLTVAAEIVEARDVALALGHRVWLPEGEHLGWTLIHDPVPTFTPSPLHGVSTIHRVSVTTLKKSLAHVAGRISTIGVAGEMDSRWKAAFLSLGASRFCAAGDMQFPPLTWHHDGRSTLADLVTWIDDETA